MGNLGKILITSFEPFGLTGRFLRKANASADVADEIAEATGDVFDFLRLPVSDASIPQFLAHVEKTKPRGILCLGEDTLARVGDVRVEPYAHDTGVSLNFFKASSARKIESGFVAESLGVPSSRCGIGVHHSNALYKTALEWGRDNGNVPVAFAHIAVIGSRRSQKDEIMDILDWMSCEHHAQPAAALISSL
jgi:hypothetical protein